MSVGFRAVQWNRAKRVYDGILLAAVALFLALFTALHWRWHPPKDNLEAIDIGIRAFGTCAFVMLTAILWIGPLARLDRRFRPLLYNRRHFGVLTFLVALAHVALLLSWYLAQGNLASLGAELTKWPDYAKFIGFPFKTLGHRRAAHSFPDGGDQPRFLAGVPDAARLEDAAHGGSTPPTRWW